MSIGVAACSGSSTRPSAGTGQGRPSTTFEPTPNEALPTTYRQACANEGSVCASDATGLIPTSLWRPLHFPVLQFGQACPPTPGSPANNSYFSGIALGTGMVRPLIAMAGDLLHGIVYVSTSRGIPGWLAFKTLWFSLPSYQGPFVVRGERLDGPGQIAFGTVSPVVAPLVVPPGPTVNSDSGYRTAPEQTDVTAPGCYGWQIDGLTFSEVIVVSAVLHTGTSG